MSIMEDGGTITDTNFLSVKCKVRFLTNSHRHGSKWTDIDLQVCPEDNSQVKELAFSVQ